MAEEKESPAQLPPFRRVVTGHSPTGEAIIESDENLVPYDPFSPTLEPATSQSVGLATIWRMGLTSFPVNSNEPWCEFNRKPVGLINPEGLMARIVDFPPGPSIMHRTLSLDFGIVLNGEIELELDNGVKTLLKQNDVAVQRGTIHAWINPGNTIVRMLFILITAQTLNFCGKVLDATPLPPGLGGFDNTPGTSVNSSLS
ncbi:hypothetical protein LOZ12_000225 [Ophidiomyces ophidiicola]|uniref:Uncharacterized protein n=1 Tax=Ophidiomyces ophidiicola TaxID=1387563 RepID=A0ACB8V483_9EURO|nr:uncharacterized protein LOZ57_000678 [Ophidiomyces ophidiicola]KAI1918076.1 hypothetical protein LOZ61_000191 [Ophidiomyces ophidiicola]KAI1924689.1 hypothetical protein LOZ64_000566 [Ophidiomyces ophidiicola]KAI1928940.1 hypothetical protein LOZ60_002050 [Ophidiomyces ophidiicola]KAI1952312.1 hypothetical protein LOZ62_001442 [Ophidiomyces ophidiicola]KAI1952599.1 hypothetical protein LOZ57_000678 [Ophidiomyces ophidiicola]